MLYGTPPRAAHRATAGGGMVLVRGLVLVRGFGLAGQHRYPPRRRHPQRTAQMLVQGLAAMIVLGLTTLVGLFVLADAQRGSALATPPDPDRALASRTVDPEPLTLSDVFPDRREVRTPARYRVTVTHLDADCATATAGMLGAVLADHGCTQVARAALAAPYGDYQVTAGVFNLADAVGAREVDEQLRQLVETGDGNFATLPASGDGVPTLQVGWRALGHYLLYCVITRPDGRLVTSDDPYAARITGELVDAYLRETMVDRRLARS
jgi:hypothetical protein